jgi:hypothetical protein
MQVIDPHKHGVKKIRNKVYFLQGQGLLPRLQASDVAACVVLLVP